MAATSRGSQVGELAHAQAAGPAQAGGGAHLLVHQVGLLQQGAGQGHEARARLGQRGAVAGTVEQHLAQRGFQLGNALGQG